MSFTSIDGNAWAEVEGDTIPISSYNIQYQINAPPQLELKVPYGYDQDWLTDGYSSYSRQSSHAHDAYRHIEVYTGQEGRRVFNGYITDTVNASQTQYSEKGSGVKIGTIIKGAGFLSLLGQSLNKPTEWANTSWSGNPFLTLDPGLHSSGLAASDAALGESLDVILMKMLYKLADWNEDEVSTPIVGGDRSAEVIKWVIKGNSSFNWDGYIETFPYNEFSELDDSFSPDFKKELMTNLLRVIQSKYKNPLQVIRLFCKMTDFALVPIIDGFYILPLVRPAGGGAGHARYYASYYPSDYESFKIAPQPRSTTAKEPATQAAIMVDRDMSFQGAFGSDVDGGSDTSLIGSYDLNNETDNDYSGGATKTIQKFGWIPSQGGDLIKDAEYASESSSIADSLCKQYVIDSQFSGATATIQFPQLATNGSLWSGDTVDESPGSLVKVRGKTANPSSKPYGDKDYYGTLKGVKYSGRVTNKAVKHTTTYIVSHVMTESLYDQISIDSHPICNGFTTTLGNNYNIFYGG